MTFTGLLVLVLAALIVLSLLFVFFRVFIVLLPVAVVALLIIWLFYRFDQKGHKRDLSNDNWFEQSTFNYGPNRRPRKKARNVQTKDIDDEQK